MGNFIPNTRLVLSSNLEYFSMTFQFSSIIFPTLSGTSDFQSEFLFETASYIFSFTDAADNDLLSPTLGFKSV